MNGDTPAAEPIVQLGEGDPSDLVELNGHRYELRRLAGFGLRTQARCRSIFNRLKALEELEEPTEADEREYCARARELAGYALPDAPAAELDALDPEQLGDLAVAFFVRGAGRSRRLQILRTLRPTGPPASLDSNGSTAATPSGGST